MSGNFIRALLYYGGEDIVIEKNKISGWFDVAMFMQNTELYWTIAPDSEIYGVVNEEYERRKEQISPENKA